MHCRGIGEHDAGGVVDQGEAVGLAGCRTVELRLEVCERNSDSDEVSIVERTRELDRLDVLAIADEGAELVALDCVCDPISTFIGIECCVWVRVTDQHTAFGREDDLDVLLFRKGRLVDGSFSGAEQRVRDLRCDIDCLGVCVFDGAHSVEPRGEEPVDECTSGVSVRAQLLGDGRVVFDENLVGRSHSLVGPVSEQAETSDCEKAHDQQRNEQNWEHVGHKARTNRFQVHGLLDERLTNDRFTSELRPESSTLVDECGKAIVCGKRGWFCFDFRYIDFFYIIRIGHFGGLPVRLECLIY